MNLIKTHHHWDNVELSSGRLHHLCKQAHDDGAQEGRSNHLCNIGELHFDAVLIFVGFHSHDFEVTRVEELTTDLSVDAAIMGNQTFEIPETLVHLRS